LVRAARNNDVTDRATLVERTRAHLERFCYPRIELSLLIVLSGVFALLVSFALLRAGVHSMPLRYGLAGAAGYLAFLGFVRLWIAWNHTRPSLLDIDVDPGHLVDALDGGVGLPGGGGDPTFFAGGRAGGGGASSSWGVSGRTGGASSWLDTDDSLVFIVVAIAAAVGSLLTIFYVLYLAPALLAEVLVDAVIIATISKRVAQADRRDWTATLIRRTCVPALLLISLLVVGGWALQRVAPDTRSIGPAIAAIRE
jgi:hypothetical protein